MRKATSGSYKKGHKQTTGEKNHQWKGEKATYNAIHHWVYRWKGQPRLCEKCGRKDLSKNRYHWANKDHTYKRILDDYIRLCDVCHWAYDKEHGLKGYINS